MFYHRSRKTVGVLVWLMLIGCASILGIQSAPAQGLPNCVWCTCQNFFIHVQQPNNVNNPDGLQDANGTKLLWGIAGQWVAPGTCAGGAINMGNPANRHLYAANVACVVQGNVFVDCLVQGSTDRGATGETPNDVQCK